MKKNYFLIIAVILVIVSCKKDKDTDPYPNQQFEVIADGIPFKTEENHRIGYTIRTWEYEKDGLKLQKVIALNDETKEELLAVNKEDFTRFYKDPIPESSMITWNKLYYYYFSLQIPIQLNHDIPDIISHIFLLRDTINNIDISLYGAAFSPKKNMQPIVIASPTRGERQMFVNQSSIHYHFNVLIFINDGMYYPERYAIDQMQLNDDLTDFFVGDPTINESYNNYGDTLYAVADGAVIELVDGHPENNGNLQDVQLNTLNDLGGNMLIIDIGNELSAVYAHITPGSFLVSKGEQVVEGQPLALLGNSGNSSAPHLHFHVAKGSQFWSSNGVPFVLKSYTKIGSFGTSPISPLVIENSMMEEYTIFNID